jgi:3-oxoacyl-[acyl-carrier protein] reductase
VAFPYASSDDRATALSAEIEAKVGKAVAINADSADPEASFVTGSALTIDGGYLA